MQRPLGVLDTTGLLPILEGSAAQYYGRSRGFSWRIGELYLDNYLCNFPGIAQEDYFMVFEKMDLNT